MKKKGPVCLYFIGVERDGALASIKIGRSRNPEGRRRDLQGGNDNAVRLLAVLPGRGYDEWRIHQRFADIRIRGEWFRPDPELLAYIEEQVAAGPSQSGKPWPPDRCWWAWHRIIRHAQTCELSPSERETLLWVLAESGEYLRFQVGRATPERIEDVLALGKKGFFRVRHTGDGALIHLDDVPTAIPAIASRADARARPLTYEVVKAVDEGSWFPPTFAVDGGRSYLASTQELGTGR